MVQGGGKATNHLLDHGLMQADRCDTSMVVPGSFRHLRATTIGYGVTLQCTTLSGFGWDPVCVLFRHVSTHLRVILEGDFLERAARPGASREEARGRSRSVLRCGRKRWLSRDLSAPVPPPVVSVDCSAGGRCRVTGHRERCEQPTGYCWVWLCARLGVDSALHRHGVGRVTGQRLLRRARERLACR